MQGAIEVWNWINANGVGLGGSAATLTAVIAALALRATVRDSHDRSRPMVVAEFLPAEHSDSTIDFRIRNYGQSVANDVRVTFDPEIPDVDDQTLVSRFIKTRYAEAIPHLSPEQELRNIWWSGEAGPGNDLVSREPTPDQVRVTLVYRGSRRKVYEEVYNLDISCVLLTTYSTSSTSVRGRLTSINRSLESASKSLQAIAGATKR